MTKLKFRIDDSDVEDYDTYNFIFNINCFIIFGLQGIHTRYYSKKFRKLKDFSSIRKLIKLRKLTLEVFDE